jgi:hypothetical protein
MASCRERTSGNSRGNFANTVFVCRARPSSDSNTTRRTISSRKSNRRSITRPTSTSSCSTRRFPARRSIRRWLSRAVCCQMLTCRHSRAIQIQFQHGAISRDDSKRFLDWAFWRDFERNGPSLYRMCQTMLQGWQRYKDHPDPRVRERFTREVKKIRRLQCSAMGDGARIQESQSRRE